MWWKQGRTLESSVIILNVGAFIFNSEKQTTDKNKGTIDQKKLVEGLFYDKLVSQKTGQTIADYLNIFLN